MGLIRRPRDCPKSVKRDGQCPELERDEQFLALISQANSGPCLSVLSGLISWSFRGHLLWGLDATSVEKSPGEPRILKALKPQRFTTGGRREKSQGAEQPTVKP